MMMMMMMIYIPFGEFLGVSLVNERSMKTDLDHHVRPSVVVQQVVGVHWSKLFTVTAHLRRRRLNTPVHRPSPLISPHDMIGNIKRVLKSLNK